MLKLKCNYADLAEGNFKLDRMHLWDLYPSCIYIFVLAWYSLLATKYLSRRSNCVAAVGVLVRDRQG